VSIFAFYAASKKSYKKFNTTKQTLKCQIYIYYNICIEKNQFAFWNTKAKDC